MSSNPDRIKKMFFQGFILHLHPRKVAAETIRFSLSFGLGGISASLVLLLFLSGILQLLSYNPDVAFAYDSVKTMYRDNSLSGWVRNIHFWSGNLLVIVTMLHCCRVFFTGAIDPRRGKNWYIGLLLLGLVFFANFSGYLLPWDQLAYWAVTIFTSMLGYLPFWGENIVQLFRGGSEVGQTTLSVFYGIHIGVLPFLFTILLVYHFWLVRKAGGLVRRKVNGHNAGDFVPVIPNLLVREAAVGLAVISSVLVFSAMVDAPLDDIANPSMSPNPAKAAWFFLGFQELLMHLHPTYVIFVLPSIFFITLVTLPFWPGAVSAPGYWFDGKGGGKVVLLSCFTGIVTTFSFILIDDTIQRSSETVTDWLSRGLLPLLGLLFVTIVCYFLLTRTLKLSRARTVMAFFTFIITTLVCLTFTGIWLRGPGMELTVLF
ncbi:MAG: cytochrome bc complex cytochrome b subunit [Desulfobulbaceae bacterium]|nr:MAG: cytochrome bc complex cytochrome b subunit [Desulfobulbaceae bacterium]